MKELERELIEKDEKLIETGNTMIVLGWIDLTSRMFLVAIERR